LALTVAAELRNCSGNFTNSPRVFRPEALYRRRGVVRGQPGAPHTRVARPKPGLQRNGLISAFRTRNQVTFMSRTFTVKFPTTLYLKSFLFDAVFDP
jgi:hypothetical protein